MLSITPIYAALLAIIYVALSGWVISTRRSQKISYGDSGNSEMLKAVRTHSNFAEYAPFGLLLIAMVELQGTSGLLVNLLGLCLLSGRMLHAYGFGKTPQIVILRQLGMVLTFTALLVAAISNLILAF
ncbi:MULTISPECIES: MAPEG family protein [unclassified Ruegeria]|uniref:MAPEG family protein n=1 Tax=unclassified Ruegeria TaxID=2625375 RepID=UPI001ADAD1AA|nr:MULTISPECIES: MAPEG family protein [unclassified Ruegeria]MBO9411269.1 MAPEG family protein [Ruegeria sp. R8_1]MBO9415470.1 MAPEG family protein [Ruegeria sp. R8_2]